MKTINTNQLTNILANIAQNVPAEITTITEPKMLKKGNPFTGVTKKSIANVMLNYNYGAEVNRQRALEGKEFDFTPKARAWGEKLGETGLITHNGQLYLSCRFLITKESKEAVFSFREFNSK